MEVCQKYGSLEFFIEDCPTNKMGHQDYLKGEGDKENIMDQVPNNSRRKETADDTV